MQEWKSEALSIPDEVGKILACRTWRYTLPDDGPPTLRSVGMEHTWSDKEVHATCNRGKEHPAPQADCQCGVWALASPRDLLETYVYSPFENVYGVVELWGQIVCGSKGWRAEYARMTSLILPAKPHWKFPIDGSARRDAKTVNENCEKIADHFGLEVLADWPTLTPVEEVK